MMNVYAIKDDKAQTWQGCYTFANNALAIREFDSAFKQGKLGLMNEYPGDFCLYQVGVLDERTGVITAHLEPVKNFADFASNEVKNNG